MTSEQFLDWLEPGVHADLIGGEIFMRSPVNLRHAHLVNFVDHLLRNYLEDEALGVLFRETVAVRLSVRDTFLPRPRLFHQGPGGAAAPTHAPFAPTFALEALSPSNPENDTVRKFAAYELHEVQEYWVLDPDKLAYRFYRRAGDMLEEFAAGAERIDSTSIPGFWVKRAWLDPAKLPRVSDCLKQLVSAKRGRGRR